MSVRRTHVLQCLVVATLTGCGGTTANQPPLMPVSGTVTLDGKPLPGVMISYVPTGSTRGTGAGGYTDKAGKYELTATHGGLTQTSSATKKK